MTDRQSPQSFDYAAGETVNPTIDVDQIITGMTVRFGMKRPRGSALVISSAAGTATTSITGPQQAKFYISDENTEALLGTYRYSVEIEDGAGDKSEVAWGYLTFSPSMV